MEIKHIRTFLAIMKEGSFTKAAECLGYTQSSITAHIHALEEALSVKLFERLSRQNVPTSAAFELLPYAKELLLTQENIANAMYRFSGRMESTVVLAASEAILMANELKKFSSDFPEVGLNIKVHSCPEIPAMVREGEADLGVFIGTEGQDLSPLRVLASKQEPTYLIGKKGLFADLPFKEVLSRENFIAHVRGKLYLRLAEQRFRDWGITPKVIEAGSISAVKELVISGLGVSLLPLSAIRRENIEGKLDLRPWDFSENEPLPRAMLVAHRQKLLSPATAEIARRIESAFKMA